MTQTEYTTLQGVELDLTALTPEEAAVFDQARRDSAERPHGTLSSKSG